MTTETDEIKLILNNLLKCLERDIEHMHHNDDEIADIKKKFSTFCSEPRDDLAPNHSNNKPSDDKIGNINQNNIQQYIKVLLSHTVRITGLRTFISLFRCKAFRFRYASTIVLWVLTAINTVFSASVLYTLKYSSAIDANYQKQQLDTKSIMLGGLSIDNAVTLDTLRHEGDDICVMFLSRSLINGTRLFIDWASHERLALRAPLVYAIPLAPSM